MSNETLTTAEEKIWKRIANIKEVIGLIFLLGSPTLGLVLHATIRQNDQEAAQKQLRKDFDAANLPDKNDRLIRIERDVEWIRKELEGKQK